MTSQYSLTPYEEKIVSRRQEPLQSELRLRFLVLRMFENKDWPALAATAAGSPDEIVKERLAFAYAKLGQIQNCYEVVKEVLTMNSRYIKIYIQKDWLDAIWKESNEANYGEYSIVRVCFNFDYNWIHTYSNDGDYNEAAAKLLINHYFWWIPQVGAKLNEEYPAEPGKTIPMPDAFKGYTGVPPWEVVSSYYRTFAIRQNALRAWLKVVNLPPGASPGVIPSVFSRRGQVY